MARNVCTIPHNRYVFKPAVCPSSRSYDSDYAYNLAFRRPRGKIRSISPTLAARASLVRRLISGLSGRWTASDAAYWHIHSQLAVAVECYATAFTIVLFVIVLDMRYLLICQTFKQTH